MKWTWRDSASPARLVSDENGSLRSPARSPQTQTPAEKAFAKEYGRGFLLSRRRTRLSELLAARRRARRRASKHSVHAATRAVPLRSRAHPAALIAAS